MVMSRGTLTQGYFSVFDKPLDEVFDAGTTLTQITQYVSSADL